MHLVQAASLARFTLALAIAAAGGAAPAQVPDGEVTFGMVAPLTGPAKELGRAVRTGFEVAFAAANEAGGVHGRQLKLVSADDAGEPARALAAARELVEKRGVFAMVGNVGSTGAPQVAAYANEKRVLLFGAVTGTAALRQRPPDRYVFNFRASYAEETAAIVRYLVEVKRIAPARIAVFAQDDALGEAGFDGFARALRKHGADPGKAVRVKYRRNTTDVEAAARTVQRAAKDLGAVVMIAGYKPAARFIEKLREARVRLVFANISEVGGNELAEELAQLGSGYADGVVVTQVVPIPTSSATPVLRYRQQLAKYAPGEKPGFMSLEGWLAAQVLVEGLQRAGRELATERLVEALEQVRSLDVGIGTALAFGPSEHQASHLVWGTVLDGKGAALPLALE